MKALRSAPRRKLVDGMMAEWSISERRTCRVLKAPRPTTNSSQADLKQPIKETA